MFFLFTIQGRYIYLYSKIKSNYKINKNNKYMKIITVKQKF